jgi:hypothetical protein
MHIIYNQFHIFNTAKTALLSQGGLEHLARGMLN